MGKKFYIKRPANALEVEVERLKEKVQLLETAKSSKKKTTKKAPRTAVYSEPLFTEE